MWRDHGLAFFFGLIFLAALIGQALTGVAYDNQQITAGLQQVSLGQYVTSSSFAVDVAENWQSEYLQFFLYIYATVWLLQKGRRNPNPSERPTPPPVSKAEQSTRQRHGTNRNSAHRGGWTDDQPDRWGSCGDLTSWG